MAFKYGFMKNGFMINENIAGTRKSFMNYYRYLDKRKRKQMFGLFCVFNVMGVVSVSIDFNKLWNRQQFY